MGLHVLELLPSMVFVYEMIDIHFLFVCLLKLDLPIGIDLEVIIILNFNA